MRKQNQKLSLTIFVLELLIDWKSPSVIYFLSPYNSNSSSNVWLFFHSPKVFEDRVFVLSFPVSLELVFDHW